MVKIQEIVAGGFRSGAYFPRRSFGTRRFCVGGGKVIVLEEGGEGETYAARKPKVQKRPMVEPATQSQPAGPPSGGMAGFDASVGLLSGGMEGFAPSAGGLAVVGASTFSISDSISGSRFAWGRLTVGAVDMAREKFGPRRRDGAETWWKEGPPDPI